MPRSVLVKPVAEFRGEILVSDSWSTGFFHSVIHCPYIATVGRELDGLANVKTVVFGASSSISLRIIPGLPVGSKRFL